MKFKSCLAAALAAVIAFAPSYAPVYAQSAATATLLPPGKQCFQATAGINGMVGTLGTLTGGSAYVAGSYGGVALTGGSGSGATANITVASGAVTAVTVLNPGVQYVVGDVLSASAASIGGVGSGFSVPIASTSVNSSLAGGSVAYYIPTTLTTKQTWQNAAESVLNQNPVPLDANGCAIVYGNGSYRQILKDSLSNTVWDVLTASTGGGGSGASGLVSLGDNTFVGTVLPWAGLVAPSNYFFAFGQSVNRTTYSALLATLTLTQTNAVCVNGNSTLGGLSDTSEIRVGAALEGSCIPPGTTVTARSAGSVTMSNAATASQTIVATIFPYGNGDGATTFNLPNLSGQTLVGRCNMGGSSCTAVTATYYGSDPNALAAPGGSQSQILAVAQVPTLSGVTTGYQPLNQTSGTAALVAGSGASSVQAQPYASGTPVIVFPTSQFGPENGFSLLSTTTGGTTSPAAPFSIVQPSTTINYIIKVLPDTVANGLSGITATFPLVVTATSSTVVNISFDIPSYINGLPADVTPLVADALMMRRGSDGVMVQVSPQSIAVMATAGVTVFSGVTGNVTIGPGLSMSGQQLRVDVFFGSLAPAFGAL